MDLKCKRQDCQFNKNLSCMANSIDVSSATECKTYQPSEKSGLLQESIQLKNTNSKNTIEIDTHGESQTSSKAKNSNSTVGVTHSDSNNGTHLASIVGAASGSPQISNNSSSSSTSVGAASGNPKKNTTTKSKSKTIASQCQNVILIHSPKGFSEESKKTTATKNKTKDKSSNFILPEPTPYNHRLKCKVECKAKCLFNEKGLCVANGITIDTFKQMPQCQTFKKP